ncbi:MAG: hypothetical protein ABSF36_03210 [Candidatus Methanomethylicaceae archaeon]|jgi:predicted nuclease of predicted toxin-antitoxin system
MAPKLLFDEMYDGLEDYFELKYEVKTVKKEKLREGAGNKLEKDNRVVDHAMKNDLIFVTQDGGAAKIAKFHKVKCILVEMCDIAEIVNKKLIDYADAHPVL